MYSSYLRAFSKYANSLFNKSASFLHLKRFTYLITKKEVQLLFRASLNRTRNFGNLQKEIFKAGRVFIKKFMSDTR